MATLDRAVAVLPGSVPLESDPKSPQLSGDDSDIWSLREDISTVGLLPEAEPCQPSSTAASTAVAGLVSPRPGEQTPCCSQEPAKRIDGEAHRPSSEESGTGSQVLPVTSNASCASSSKAAKKGGLISAESGLLSRHSKVHLISSSSRDKIQRAGHSVKGIFDSKRALSSTSQRKADKTVTSLLAGVNTLHGGNNTEEDAQDTVTPEAHDDTANFTIFTEEGTLPSFPVIRFLSPFAVWMDRSRMLFALWTLGYTPFVLVFQDLYPDFVHDTFTQAVEVVGDIIFLLGACCYLVTTVGDSNAGREFVAFKEILRRRCRSPNFWGDILSCVPFVVGLLFGEVAPPTSTFFRRFQVLKTLRVHWVLEMPASHFETRFFSPFQVFRMFVWIILSMHLMSCIWYAVVVQNHTLDRHLSELVDIEDNSHYVLSFKYGCYMVTGKPVAAYSEDELTLIAFSAPLGGMFFAFIYGRTTMLISRMNMRFSKHHKHIATIQRTLGTLDIPIDLRQKITKYHHFLAVHQNSHGYNLLMQGLSVNLFIELRAHLFKKLFSHGPLFQEAPASFSRALLQIMVEVTFCPGDIIIRCGDLGDQMYFVVKGRLEVLSHDNEVVGKIAENQYFGEVALLVDTPRLVSIRAVTYCLLAMIMREKFLPMLENFPKLKEKMMEKIKSYASVKAALEKANDEEARDSDSPTSYFNGASSPEPSTNGGFGDGDRDRRDAHSEDRETGPQSENSGHRRSGCGDDGEARSETSNQIGNPSEHTAVPSWQEPAKSGLKKQSSLLLAQSRAQEELAQLRQSVGKVRDRESQHSQDGQAESKELILEEIQPRKSRDRSPHINHIDEESASVAPEEDASRHTAEPGSAWKRTESPPGEETPTWRRGNSLLAPPRRPSQLQGLQSGDASPGSGTVGRRISLRENLPGAWCSPEPLAIGMTSQRRSALGPVALVGEPTQGQVLHSSGIHEQTALGGSRLSSEMNAISSSSGVNVAQRLQDLESKLEGLVEDAEENLEGKCAELVENAETRLTHRIEEAVEVPLAGLQEQLIALQERIDNLAILAATSGGKPAIKEGGPS